jgi:uncharacterized membrane protein (DUF485 family)
LTGFIQINKVFLLPAVKNMEDQQNNSKNDNLAHFNQVIASLEFKDLVRKRTTVSVTLTVIICTVYFGFLLIIAFDKELFAYKIGENMTLGLPAGVGIIIFTWLITGFYVYWSNRYFDQDILKLKNDVISGKAEEKSDQ